MKHVLIRIFFLVSLSHSIHSSTDEDVRQSLISFAGSLSGNNGGPSSLFNWNVNSDPCSTWNFIGCDRKNTSVTRLYLTGLNLFGNLDMNILCSSPPIAKSLSIVMLNDNNVTGSILSDISNCRQLTRFHVSRNRLSGEFPDSLSSLSNLRKLDFSFNNFSGKLPDLGRISGLKMFQVQNNRVTGKIPDFDFSNLVIFNVSYNNFTGRVPKSAGKYFGSDSFMGNPALCGNSVSTNCPKRSGPSTGRVFVYLGYTVLALALIGVIVYKIRTAKKKKKNKSMKADPINKESYSKSSFGASSTEYKKSSISRQEEIESKSMAVVTSPSMNGLRFEDLLRAPAELMGRGKYGSLYKVACENGVEFAVKRIKDWGISGEDFRKRMQRIDEIKHPNVVPVAAFYSSKQEKLLVYEFLSNGSLFRLLHGIQLGQVFEWAARLNVAARIAEALAFMHQKLGPTIPHGNLKSSNILFNKNMDPCISEYGLMAADQDPTSSSPEVVATLEADIYGFGVILLELLTGKLVQNNGFDLAKWVHSVVREEWTVEVFDKSLVREGASEEGMVSLLQVATKCVNPAPEARPNIGQVVAMINSIKEVEDGSSVSYEP